ncbi:MAG TPA: PilT/PilU family type 4a pilus ATPase [Candidatus Magasanikbacteria bacterium]|nr:PilT/PilU family type 4a pilus ATPase [Candidatus Magasanikbacteria bacterium]
MKQLKSYFEYAIEKKASDLHLVGEELPLIRVHGNLEEIEDKKLPLAELKTAILEILSKDQKDKFAEEMELDFSEEIAGYRFRINIHQQEGKIGLAARLIPQSIPTPEELDFSPIMYQLSKLYDGLVLVTGPTGSGKSTTVAAMLEMINKERKAHIVTIEDPIEFIFEDKKSLVEQREVGIDTKSFQEALKRVLRQDPNVIFVGEMRDPETIAATLTAAETGHLVFSTLHTPSAAESIERIIDVFEGFKQKQVLVQLSSVLRAVVSQQLIPSKKGKLVAAREILINSSAVANLIRENKIAQIPSTMQISAKEGMVTLRNNLLELVKKGIIDEEVAEKRIGENSGKNKFV